MTHTQNGSASLQKTHQNCEAGFTLVELMIVLMVVALLLAGVLKWRELIQNSRITSTISEYELISEAVSTFFIYYQGLPGDMITATTRLPNCDGTAATQCYAGNADGMIGPFDGSGAALAAPIEERVQFWRHLHAVDLVTRVDNSGNIAFGNMQMPASIGGGWRVGHEDDGTTVRGGPGGEAAVGGHYLELTTSPTAAADTLNAGQLLLTPAIAAQIDRKVDDSLAAGGMVLGFGPGACFNAGVNSGYNEPSGGLDCGLYLRIQGL